MRYTGTLPGGIAGKFIEMRVVLIRASNGESPILKDFTITPAKITLPKPGSYTFELHNEGAQTHSLEIEGNGIEKKGPQITFGQKGSFTVELKKSGKYEMYCPVDSHKSLGMTGTITVS